jgi:hypothetical protein
MARIEVDVTQLASLATLVRAVVRHIRRLALAGALGAAAVAVVLARGGYSVVDGVLTILLLGPSAILVFFTQGLLALLAVPERLRRMPREGQERLAELTRVAGDARTTRARSAPLLLWRLRGAVGSLRGVVGVGLTLRVFTPHFLGLTLVAALACILLAGAGLVALLVLAAS